MRRSSGLSLIALFTVVLFCIGGLQNVSAASKPVTIRFSTWNVMEGATKQVTEEMIARFEAANPNVKVEIIGIPYEQMLQQTLVAVAGGDQPDLMHLVAQWAPPFAHMGALEPLDDYFSTAELDDMPKAAVEAGRINGKVMSVPWVLGSIVVFAWKDVLAKAGLPLEIPETWPEFKKAVAKVSAIGDETYGFGARTSKGPNSAFWFFPVMWGHGGEFEDAEGNIVFNNPGTVAALDWYKEIGEKKYTPMGMGVREVRNLMGQGKLGFIFDGPWMKGIFRNITGKGEAIDDAYVYGMFPKGTDGKRHGIGNNHVFSVSSKSKAKKEAVALVKYITQNEECVRLFYDKFGGMPIYKRFLKDPYYGNDPWVRTFLGSAEFANSVPSKNPNLSAALEEVAVAMQGALLGGETQKAAATAEKNIKKIYKQK